MKALRLSLAMGSLLLAGSAFAQSDLQTKGEAVILKSCAPCHDTSMTPSFVNAAGAIQSDVVKSYAPRISARVQSATRPMPPPSAPAYLQPTAQEKADLLAYVATLIPATPTTPPPGQNLPLAKLKVEPGFKIEVLAEAKGARSLTVSSGGVIFVGTGGFSDVDPDGRIFAIVPTAKGFKTVDFTKGLNNPNGVVVHGNDLYVAESNRVLLFKNAVDAAQIIAAGTPFKATYTVIKDDIRTQGNHHWKYLAIGPDEKLYMPIGADCNVCAEDRENAAGIFRMNLDGSNFEQVAKGVRNTVGFDFHPVTGKLWFTDNGRDELGDTLPADELNTLNTNGQDFGFPYCFASNVTDPDFGKGIDCNSSTYTKPAIDLGPHSAALGMTFYNGSQFPATYKNSALIAEHGSWNSSRKVGYRLMIVEEKTTAGKTALSYRPFITGWVDDAGKDNWGRPVDVKNYIDGTVILSDDHAGVVYRISHQ